MSYREDERKKAVNIREAFFRDAGDGFFSKKKGNLSFKTQLSIYGRASEMTL